MPACDAPAEAFSEVPFKVLDAVLKGSVIGEDHSVMVANDVGVHGADLLRLFLYTLYTMQRHLSS